MNKREFLTSVAGYSDEQLKAQGIEFNQLEEEIEDLEKQLSEKSDVFKKGNQNKVVTWEDVKEKLHENEYAVEMLRFRYFDKDFTDSIIYAALIISPKTKRAPEVVIFPKGDKFESKYIKYYRNSIKFKIEDKWTYDAVWKPMEKEVSKGSKIYLSPEGIYNQLNLEALKDNSGDYLLDKKEFVLVSNTKDIVEKNHNSSNKSNSAVLMGNPAFYDVRMKADSVVYSISDSIIANESHQVLITQQDNITATFRDELIIDLSDKIVAVEEDGVLIKTEDNIYAKAEDNIFITEADKVYTR